MERERSLLFCRLRGVLSSKRRAAHPPTHIHPRHIYRGTNPASRLCSPRCAVRAAPARPGRHASLGNDTGLARMVRVTHESRPLRPTFRGTNPASTSRAPWRRPGRSYAPGEARFARKGYGSCEDRAGHAQTANTAKSERVENVLLRCSRRSSQRTSPIFRNRLLNPFVRDWRAF